MNDQIGPIPPIQKHKLPNKRSELGKIPNHLMFHGWYGI